MVKAKKQNDVIGAAMVVGGGVAGAQAALDLANAGFKVYLVEKGAAIGGTMAQLDKTFPTNDCSMCILAPKLVEVGRHENIEILTLADLEKLEGEPGNFTAHVRRRPRYVDEEMCTGCTDCAQACPVQFPDEYEVGLVKRRAAYRPYAQAIPNVFALHKRGKAPCRDACPIDQAAQGYIALIGEGKFKEALALIRKQNPLPGICGRVCHHPCEKACVRGEVDSAISIRSLKRFVADWEAANEPDYSFVTDYNIEKKNTSVAVVGAGPAGLTCAHDLALAGYDVDVFEALPFPGGMLRVGIPRYRLPQAVIDREAGFLEKLGVRFRCNAELGKSFAIDDLFQDGYKAIFLGIGAHKSLTLGCGGEGLEGVVGAVEFLREFALTGKVWAGRKVAVIGGGNAAIDAARTARRLGAEVTIYYRRTRTEMPADNVEIEEARREGVGLELLVAPDEILGKENRVTGMRLQRMELGEPDASGRRRPVPIPGDKFDVAVDMVIPAISQAPAITPLEGQAGICVTKWKTVEVDEQTGMTGRAGVFAGGDMVSGPGMVTEAMAQGRRAARGIAAYLNCSDFPVPLPAALEVVKPADVPKDKASPSPRAHMAELAVTERGNSFEEVELGLDKEQAIAEAKRCLSCGVCSECLECVRACRPDAIRHFQTARLDEIKVGAVILAPGFEEFDARLKSEYGWGRLPDVVTSIEFERLLSASGPFGGHLKRLSDGKDPVKVAWLQCIGSRDTTVGRGYCSSVCCMYATKQAVIAREHAAGVEPTIFFMDMRSFGKEFDRYIERAEREYGVRFIRSRVDSVERENGKLALKYEDEGGVFSREEFDMVVLSVGLTVDKDTKAMLGRLGLEVDKYDFVAAPAFNPTHTSRPGVFAAGAAAGPKDIPESVMEASAAVAQAAGVLAPARWTETTAAVFPAERNIAGEPPRVGAFICHCGINIGGVVDVPGVVEYAASLPWVAYVERNLFTCSSDTQKLIAEKIAEHGLNRVVVASCTPRTHEPLFRATLREAGLNPYLFEMANIREHCSWVHMRQPAEATAKAKELVRMAVARAVNLSPLADIELPVTQTALVIGGGVAGLTAAIGLAEQGFQTYVVEKEAELGGNLRHIRYTLDGQEIAPFLADLADRVRRHDKIKVFTGARIKTLNGFVGSYVSTIVDASGAENRIEHGVVIVATGANMGDHKEFALGETARVMTQRDLEQSLGEGKVPFGSTDIAMIQCVGSRDESHLYCSRICCSEAVKNALKLKELNPDANIYMFYRDLRTYGLAEDYYREAREKGIFFARFEPDNKPVVVPKGDKASVKWHDIIVGEEVEMEVDLVALAEGTWPDVAANKELAEMLKVPLTADGFFLEAHMKLRPVDFATEGVFVCGLAHAPKTIEESIAQAQAAAARASTILAKPTIRAEGRVAVVNEKRCIACGTCESVCPYGAIEVNKIKMVAEVNAGLCKGCGSCAAACWSAAVDIAGVTHEQLLDAISAL
ncbi:MAG: FAD-dependent oxidoreductase [Candidatus Eisenbacteria bacterium]|nr:FAD-dependent oxidoreductase [Candidatus Eisenbacteria bacterium]